MTTLTNALLLLWVGAALFFAAVVAPAAFSVLSTPGLAGRLVGRLLPTLFISGIVVAVIAVADEVRQRPDLSYRRLAAIATMLICCALAQFVVARRIDRLRSDAATPVSGLAPDDPRRLAFGRLHALSVAALAAAMLAAGVAVVTRQAPPVRLP